MSLLPDPGCNAIDEVSGQPMHTLRELFEALNANKDLLDEWETERLAEQWTFFNMRPYLSEKQFNLVLTLYNRMVTRSWGRRR